MNKRLSLQLFSTALLALVLSFGVFFGLYAAGITIMNHTFYQPSFTLRKVSHAFQELQSYVTQEAVTPDDLSPLDGWHPSVQFHIYNAQGEILYDSLEESDSQLPGEYSPELEDANHAFALTFSDGTQATVYLYYAPAKRYLVVGVLASLAALLVFSVTFMSMVHRKVRYIQQLQADLQVLSGGKLDYSVTKRGHDELAALAEGIDAMRLSILAHQRTEEEIRTANAQLITAISHDLRTPLTTLLAYLELVERGKYADDAQLRAFIHRSLDKTYQIRDMADKLFEYFFVSSTSWESPAMETVSAESCMRQFWGEYAFSLEARGFRVDCRFPPLQGQLSVNLELLRRVFDNLYSNLLKYAAVQEPILLQWQQEGQTLTLCISNAVPAQSAKAGTNIGLSTCRRIMLLHNGSFEAGMQGDHFTVRLSLPLLQGGAS